MKLWAYNDAHNWGAELVAVAEARGYNARLFEQYREVTDGVVFVHMHAHPSVRTHHKRLVSMLATKPDVKLIPSYRLAMLYDDKLEQLRQLARWLPPTRLLTSPAQARDFIDSQPPLPIVSKSGEGSGVRILTSYDEMHREVKLAFSDLGIKNRFGTRHHSYLYWQKYLGPLEKTIRVLSIGSQRMALVRGRRNEVDPEPNLDELTAATEFATMLAKEEGFNFCGFDIARFGESFRLLKVTVGWPLARYQDCVFKPDGRKGSDFWTVTMDEIEKGMVP